MLDKHLSVKPSPIQGNGLFTNIDIPKGKLICLIAQPSKVIKVNEWRTLAGQMVNHQKNNNVVIEQGKDKYDQDYFLFAVRDIKAGEELFADYTKLKFPFDNSVYGYIEDIAKAL